MGCERLLAYIIPVSAALPHDYFPVLLMPICRPGGLVNICASFSSGLTFVASFRVKVLDISIVDKVDYIRREAHAVLSRSLCM
jgi:hypothetical protein